MPDEASVLMVERRKWARRKAETRLVQTGNRARATALEGRNMAEKRRYEANTKKRTLDDRQNLKEAENGDWIAR